MFSSTSLNSLFVFTEKPSLSSKPFFLFTRKPLLSVNSLFVFALKPLLSPLLPPNCIAKTNFFLFNAVLSHLKRLNPYQSKIKFSSFDSYDCTFSRACPISKLTFVLKWHLDYPALKKGFGTDPGVNKCIGLQLRPFEFMASICASTFGGSSFQLATIRGRHFGKQTNLTISSVSVKSGIEDSRPLVESSCQSWSKLDSDSLRKDLKLDIEIKDKPEESQTSVMDPTLQVERVSKGLSLRAENDKDKENLKTIAIWEDDGNLVNENIPSSSFDNVGVPPANLNILSSPNDVANPNDVLNLNSSLQSNSLSVNSDGKNLDNNCTNNISRSENFSHKRSQLPYVLGSTPWMGETPLLVRELALEIVAFEEQLMSENLRSGGKENGEGEEAKGGEEGEGEEGDKMGSPVARNGDLRASPEKRKEDIAVEEEKRFRHQYANVGDKEEKLRAFAARQVAARMLGCLGYLCSKCWLPKEDCNCSAVQRISFNAGVCLWLYLHPKEYLRKNNTGKLLWQALGEENVKVCICGIAEHEAAMWQEFRKAGSDSVWCVFPARRFDDTCVSKMSIPTKALIDSKSGTGYNGTLQGQGNERQQGVLHFVLIDGTWSNCRAMLNRLMEHSGEVWGGKEMTCVALSPSAPSVMHALRPQPSKERTCTAAAAANLLRELDQRPELDGRDLKGGAEAVDKAVELLIDSLSDRRRRSGRTTVRLGEGKNLGYGMDRAHPHWYGKDSD